MPIVYHQLIPANAGQPGYEIATNLERYINLHFGDIRPARANIGPGSCCAAVAIRHIGNYYRASPAANLPYGIIFGNSRIGPSRLDFGELGDHAEQGALTASRKAFQDRPGEYEDNPANDFYTINNDAVLFVELSPCHIRNGGGCIAWLEGGGTDRIVNPYNGIINGNGHITLHVWFKWIYQENGVSYKIMTDSHKADLKRRREENRFIPQKRRKR